MTNALHIQPFSLGDFMTNCFVVHPTPPNDPDGSDEQASPCWLVDVGFDPDEMIAYIKRLGLAPKKIILTHAHMDHIGGIADVLAEWPDLPILIHPEEQDAPGDPAQNLSLYFGLPMTAPSPTGTIAHGDKLEFEGFTFEVRHTPGHSPGSVTLYQPDHAVAIVGDTLFMDGIGRTDFPTSDTQTLLDSINNHLFSLPDETAILPGHGPATTIGRERQTNPFVGANRTHH